MKHLTLIIAILSSVCSLSANSKALKFSFDMLASEAELLSKLPYENRVSPLPKALQNLTYSQYNLMRYNIDHDLWSEDDLPFRISFFPLGTPLYSLPVQIYEINYDGTVVKTPFSPDLFQYEPQVLFIKKQMPLNAGYAGFKIRYKSIDNTYPNEFAAFLGNSYFRIICNKSSYGLSNRGIAINTGLEGVEEQFPAFEKFYIQKPHKGDSSITLYAILNGKSLTGAYAMKITPGNETSVEIKSVLYSRNKMDLICLAPITSMFWFTLGQPNNFHDYRPSVHNSQGLILKESDEFLYEPLANYPLHKMVNNDINCKKLEYFGLVQRNRDYNYYMDPSVKYHLNPDCWILPSKDWGKGKLRLFVLPTLSEWMDNINLFWIPELPPEIGKPYHFDYKILYSLQEPDTKLPYVRYTNWGQDLNNADNSIFALSIQDKNDLIKNAKNITIDLKLPQDVSLFSTPTIEKIDSNNTWRLLFTLKPKKKLAYTDKPFIITCSLKDSGKVISEEWYFLWYPL